MSWSYPPGTTDADISRYEAQFDYDESERECEYCGGITAHTGYAHWEGLEWTCDVCGSTQVEEIEDPRIGEAAFDAAFDAIC